MKAMQFKYIVVACLLALTVSSQSFAVDVAEATSVMTDLEALVTAAQRSISAEAGNLDYDATADEAIPRSVAIDNEVKAGRDALAAMEEAIAKGDDAAAEAAEDDLAAALRRARDLLAGDVPATSPDDQSDGSQDDSVAGPESEWDAPNIYDVPWKTQGIRAYYDSLFASVQDAESFGKTQGSGGVEQDATPE